MANVKSRLKAPKSASTKKGRGKIKTSSTGEKVPSTANKVSKKVPRTTHKVIKNVLSSSDKVTKRIPRTSDKVQKKNSRTTDKITENVPIASDKVLKYVSRTPDKVTKNDASAPEKVTTNVPSTSKVKKRWINPRRKQTLKQSHQLVLNEDIFWGKNFNPVPVNNEPIAKDIVDVKADLITKTQIIKKKNCSKDKFKILNNILMSELKIERRKVKSKNAKTPDAIQTITNGMNNNNDSALSNQNDAGTVSNPCINPFYNNSDPKGTQKNHIITLSNDVSRTDVQNNYTSKTDTEDLNNKCQNTLFNGKSKYQANEKTKNNKCKAVDKIDQRLKADAMCKMKKILAPEENCIKSVANKSTSSKTNINDNDVIETQQKGSNPKKSKKQKDPVEKAEAILAKTKQVTLSNGLVLTLTLVKCDYCQKSFSNKSSLSRHMLTHVDLRSHHCPYCPRKFRYQSTLRLHLHRRHPDEFKEVPDDYMCHICDKTFLMQENLELHLATHVKSENNFQCVFCDKRFTYRLLLLQHEKVHLNLGKFKCYLCDTTFDRRNLIIRHMRTHKLIKDYTCQYCGKAFLRLNSIRRHLRLCHSDYAVQCPICLKKLKGHLPEHMLLHNQKRPHSCPECGQTFTQSTQLTVHRRSHTGDRPYPCRICQQAFAHSSALVLHIRKHTGEKPYRCAMCPLTFSQLPHMKGHMNSIHGKLNTYKCQKCGEFFKLKIDLNAHMKICSIGEQDQSFEEKVQTSVQSGNNEKELGMSLSKMRFLLALLLTMIASKEKLKYLGFNKRLIDELLVESLEAMGHTPCKDQSLTPLKRLKENIQILMDGTVPKAQMERFRSENKTVEELLVILTEEKTSQ